MASEASGFKRSANPLEALLITLSGITPAVSVFAVAPGIIQAAGTGALLSFLAAAVIAVFMAFVYAELASAYPLTGGEYAIVGRQTLATAHASYRMPCYPLPPLLGLAALLLVLYANYLDQAVGRPSLLALGTTMGLAFLYDAWVFRRRTPRVLREPEPETVLPNSRI
jgi:amino acid transporter